MELMQEQSCSKLKVAQPSNYRYKVAPFAGYNNNMRTLIATILLSLIPYNLNAGPIHWIKSQFKDHPVRTSIILGMTAATVNGIGLAHCRQGPVENCQGKYGAAWGSFGAATGTNLSLIIATKSCWKDQDPRFCSLFAYSGSAIQTGFGINQWRRYAPQTPTD